MRRAFSVAVFPRLGEELPLHHQPALNNWLPPGRTIRPG